MFDANGLKHSSNKCRISPQILAGSLDVNAFARKTDSGEGRGEQNEFEKESKQVQSEYLEE